MESIRVRGLTGDDPLYHYEQACETYHALHEVADATNIRLDLTDAQWTVPMYLSPVAVAVQELHAAGVEVDVQCSNKIRQYIQQIGFPDGHVRPSESYDNSLPLCLLNTDADEDAIEIVGSKIYELLRTHLPNQPRGVLSGIQYTIAEIIDNVDQHSRCRHGTLLVQYYPRKEALDICVADDGVSIPGTYDEFGIDYVDAVDAVRKALRGISTKPDLGHERGYGLRTTTRMVCDGLHGSILLSSNEATLYKEGSGDPTVVLPDQRWPGTVFAARLNLPDEAFDWEQYV
jgi:hypothetical protein